MSVATHDVRGLDRSEDFGHGSVTDISHNITPSRPARLDRAMSSPPISPLSQAADKNNTRFMQNRTFQDVLTPPLSPLGQEYFGRFGDIGDILTPPSSSHRPQTRDENIDLIDARNSSSTTPPPEEVPILEYPFELETVRDKTGKFVEYGSGAWSTVFKATSKYSSSKATCNPHNLSPTIPSTLSPLVVAVKTPHRRDAHPILRSEAQILSHLARSWDAEEHIVAFHGFVSATSSIVLSAVPLSLSRHIADCAVEMRSMYMRYANSFPVVGEEKTWLALATQMIESLYWLHDMAEVIHGDIKPHNILLRPKKPFGTDGLAAFPYTPLLVDFSSSCYLSSSSRNNCPGALSAVTREYTAPEFLSSSVLRNPTTLPTTAADVFSLAVTLLVAATGELTVYPAPNVFQRQAMATQGWNVISFAQRGDQGLRVPKFGIVEQVLERAVLKAGMGRIDARTWADLVKEKDSMSSREPAKRS